jgi:mannose-6-phosphate isomerase
MRAWYVIDCEEDTEIIFGHTASTKEEFVEMIENGQWNKLLRRVKVKSGDFFMFQAAQFMRYVLDC